MSNGLVLCCWRSPTPFDYYICDPLTRQWITLPRRGPKYHEFFKEGLITRVNEDHMLTSYIVVRLKHFKSNYLNLEIFSSQTGKWIGNKLPCPISIKLWERVEGSIYCYGALHWQVINDKGIHVMLAFDPYKDPKCVRLISFPDDRDFQSEENDIGTLQLCGESQGTLRYFEVAHGRKQFYLFSMWSMKDYEKGEWCCEFRVRRSDLHSNDLELSNWLSRYGWFTPLSFHPLNPNVVYMYCMEPGRIVSYNILNRRLDVASKPIGQFISSYFAIPFVLPRWPVLVPIASVKSKKEKVECRN